MRQKISLSLISGAALLCALSTPVMAAAAGPEARFIAPGQAQDEDYEDEQSEEGADQQAEESGEDQGDLPEDWIAEGTTFEEPNADWAEVEPEGGIGGLDFDGDGSVETEEAHTSRAVIFLNLDFDADGIILVEEAEDLAEVYASVIEGYPLADPEDLDGSSAWLERADSDGDGAVTFDEFINAPMQTFEELDVDDDGDIGAEEEPS
ncbi:EF-hand domain-containing protein [Brevundimonas sp.]|uniref:EF-hand domain-containing protein n=1 Tax=Brevundimonas sp. TaxID=1871086 RepID=UPI00260EB49F|nr:EF-hand domain-containing protein [Brevundimonas sp.]